MFIHLKSKLLLYGMFFLVLATGCMTTKEPDSNQSSALKQALATIEGRFGWRPEANAHDYSKWEELINAALAQSPGAERDNPPESLLAELVDCFDDSSPSSSIFRDQTIPLGWVCYAALTGLVYHEEVDENGDITRWDGYPKFPASLQDMKAAKAAWQKVLIKKTYLAP